MSTPKQYTAAVIGCGAPQGSSVKGVGCSIGNTHGQMYVEHPRTTLIAAADIKPENLAAFRTRFDVPHGHADYRVILSEYRPDIVSIATHVGLHRRMIEDAARAGMKGIFCEKPFVASPAELRAVYDAVRETGVKLVIAHVRRYRPAFMAARDLYQSGAIGQPVMCLAGIQDWDLSEWGSHWLDMFRFFHNDRPLKWVMGQARVRGQRIYGHATEEHAVAYFEFEGGGRGVVDGGVKLNGDAQMTLVGTDGSIRVYDENRLVIDSPNGRETKDFTEPTRNNWHSLWLDNLQGLVDWLDGGAEPPIGLTYTGPSAELNLAAYVSALRGDRVDFPLDESFWSIDEWPLETIARRAT